MRFIKKLWNAFVAGLALLSGVQLTRASTINTGSCIMPQGNYLDSCTQPRIIPYQSSDPYIPATCELTTTCNTIYDTMAPIKQKYHVPSGTLFNDVTNMNGTLIFDGAELGKTRRPSAESDDASGSDCYMPSGSFANSCRVFLQRYKSTDPNLQRSALCKAAMDCQTLTGSQSSSAVYYNIAEQSQNAFQRIENCDGNLVVGQEDNRCSARDPEQIKAISAREGRSTLTI